MHHLPLIALVLVGACSDGSPRVAGHHTENLPSPIRGRLIGFGDTDAFILIADSPAVRAPLSEPLVDVNDSTAIGWADGRRASRVDLGGGNGVAVIIWPRAAVTDTTSVINARRVEIVATGTQGRVSGRGQSNVR